MADDTECTDPAPVKQRGIGTGCAVGDVFQPSSSHGRGRRAAIEITRIETNISGEQTIHVRILTTTPQWVKKGLRAGMEISIPDFFTTQYWTKRDEPIVKNTWGRRGRHPKYILSESERNTTRQCPKCCQVKPLSDFYIHPVTHCIEKTCRACRHQYIHQRNCAHANEYYDADPIYWYARRMAQSYKHGAIARGKDYESGLTIEFFYGLLKATPRCECCDRAFSYARPTKKYQHVAAGPSIDRALNERGYFKDNIVIICNSCNFKKNALSEEDAQMILDYIHRQRVKRARSIRATGVKPSLPTSTPEQASQHEPRTPPSPKEQE